MLNILYEDEAVLVVWKPVGMESQSGHGFDADMVSEIRRYLSTGKPVDNHKLSTKSVEPYVGVIHRLDKPVSGVMVYAKTKNAAAALSKQVAEGKMHKKYLAVLCGKPVDNVEKYVDYLLKDEKENTSRIVDMGIKGGKRAELICRVLESKTVEPYGELTLAEIELLTGRHHQIRVQMSGHGCRSGEITATIRHFARETRRQDPSLLTMQILRQAVLAADVPCPAAGAPHRPVLTA